MPNDSFTYAKLQNVSATSRVLGRISASAGDIEELTGANVRTICGLATTDTVQFESLAIGIASPGRKFHLHESTPATATGFRMTNGIAGTETWEFFLPWSGAALGFGIHNTALSAPVLYFDNDGKCGMGKINPSAELDVNGEIIGTGYLLTEAPGSNATANGIKETLTAGENLAFGDICYFKSDGKLWKADANGTATYPAMAMALGTISADATGSFLLMGVARNDSWSWTVGGIVYLSTTAGGITQTQPSSTDEVIQILGIATHADRVYFKPELNYITHV